MNNSCYYKYENIINSSFTSQKLSNNYVIIYQNLFLCINLVKERVDTLRKFCQQGITRKAHEPQNSACSEIRGQRYCEKIKAI